MNINIWYMVSSYDVSTAILHRTVLHYFAVQHTPHMIRA
jgi:hypothetical protein